MNTNRASFDDDEKERARRAALWLTAALASTPYQLATIKWEEKGLRADIMLRVRGAPVIDGYWNFVKVGDLLSTYSHMREDDNFHAWLRMKMGDYRTILDDGTVVLPRNESIDVFLETLPAGVKFMVGLMKDRKDGLLYPHVAVRHWQEVPSLTDDGIEIRSSGSGWTCDAIVSGRGALGEYLHRQTGLHYETWSLHPFNSSPGPHILDFDPGHAKCLHGKKGRHTEITERDVRDFAHAYTLDYFKIHKSNVRFVEILSCGHHNNHHANWACKVKFSAKGDQVLLLITSAHLGLEVFAHNYLED